MHRWIVLLAILLFLQTALAFQIEESEAESVTISCDTDLDNLTVYIDDQAVNTVDGLPCPEEAQQIRLAIPQTGGAYRLVVEAYRDGNAMTDEKLVTSNAFAQKIRDFFRLEDSLFVVTLLLTVLFSVYFFSLRFMATPSPTYSRLRIEEEFAAAESAHLPPGMPNAPKPGQTEAGRGMTSPSYASQSPFTFSDQKQTGTTRTFNDQTHVYQDEHKFVETGTTVPATLADAKQKEFDAYVTASLTSGSTLALIRQSLIGAGWAEALVDRELAAYFQSSIGKK